MQPVNHLHSIAIINIGNVEVVLLFNDLKTSDLAELGSLVVKQHFVRVCNVKESPVPVYLCFGVAWEMRPYVLCLWTEDHL